MNSSGGCTPLNTLSNLLTLSILLLGIFLITIPSRIIALYLPCLLDEESSLQSLKKDLTHLEIALTQLLGGVLVTLALTCSIIKLSRSTFNYELGSDGRMDKATKLGSIRTVLSSQFCLGLCMILVGFIQTFENSTRNPSSYTSMTTISIDEEHCGPIKAINLLILGVIFILLTCVGLMISYWPASASGTCGITGISDNDNSTISRNEQNRLLQSCFKKICCIKSQRDTTTPQTVPLLSDENQTQQIENEARNADLENVEDGNNENGESTLSNSSFSSLHQNETLDQNDSEYVSRVTGTRRLIKLAGPHSLYLYIGCVVLLIRLPFSLSIPHFVSSTLGALSRLEYSVAKSNILFLFVSGTIDAALDFWCIFLFDIANLKIVKGVRIDTFAAILRQEMAFFDVTKSGDLASRLNSDCGEMGGDLTWFFRFSIESIVRISGIVTYMLLKCPKLGLCAISVVPFVALVNKKYGDWLHKNAMEVQAALAEANSVAQEAFSCVRTVIASACEGFEQDKYCQKINQHYHLCTRQIYARGFYYMMISTFLINTFVQALLLYVGTILVRNQDLKVEVLIAFMLYQSQLQNEVLNLFNSFTALIKSSGAGEKVFALLDRVTPPPGTGSCDVQVVDNDIVIDISHQFQVSVKDVYFAYPSRPDQQVLNGLNLDIPSGKTIALVGASGCGKSTIIALLQRLYDPTNGEVLINGANLRDLNIESHRRRIGIVTQDPILFSGTIKFNLIYGKPETNMENAITAAKLANAHDFIESFSDKYDTEVGERGVQLSGGQKQRIAIARAIISRPSLLLLDEATSSLDSEAEKLVQDALDQLLSRNKDMTTIIIAHRLQTVRNADCIVVIDEGRVHEKGTHEQLLKAGGIYQKMLQRAENSNLLPECQE